MLTGYVDDTTDALAGVDPGVSFENGKLVMRDELVEGDKLIEEDERTMNLLKELADTVFKCVQFTVDFPTAHREKSVPVLDLRVHCKGDQIAHKFYKRAGLGKQSKCDGFVVFKVEKEWIPCNFTS